MEESSGGPFGPHGAGSEDAVDLRRYRQALRRSWPLILTIVGPLTGVVLVVSLLLPPTYRATATIVLDDQVSGTGGSSELVGRELETLEHLATTRPVLAASARKLGTSLETLSETVSASASAEANLVRITAEDDDAGGAARRANTVAETFLAERVATAQQSLAATRKRLLARIERAERGGQEDELASLRESLRGLAVQEAGIGGSLTLAERAQAPERAASPRILQNTLFAFFGFAFIAVLIALVREQIAPRAGDAREVAELIGAALLVEMPAPKKTARSRREQADPGAFEPILDAVETLLSPSSPRTVLVTSLHRDAASAGIAAGLAHTFVRENERVVLVSSGAAKSARRTDQTVAELVRRSRSGEDVDELLTRAEGLPGLSTFSYDADASLASHGDVEALVAALRTHDVTALVVAGPPLLVSRNGPLLAALVNGVVVVCRPERTTRDGAGRARRLLRAVGAHVLGVVSVGGDQVVPYVPVLGDAAGPNERGHEPQMPPVQGVDEEAVREQSAPGGEQGGRADSVGVARGQRVPQRKRERREKQREQR
jgi:capsular polysaccharide biosynthesis protein